MSNPQIQGLTQNKIPLYVTTLQHTVKGLGQIFCLYS